MATGYLSASQVESILSKFGTGYLNQYCEILARERKLLTYLSTPDGMSDILKDDGVRYQALAITHDDIERCISMQSEANQYRINYEYKRLITKCQAY